jgi:hypothetical protein
MRSLHALLIAGGTLVLGTGPALAQQPPLTLTIEMAPENGFKIPGRTTLTNTGGTTPGMQVTIVLNGFFIPENSYPAAIYAGTCAKHTPRAAFTLTPMSTGKSQTLVPGTSIEKLLAFPHVVAVASASNAQTTISCGTIGPPKS